MYICVCLGYKYVYVCLGYKYMFVFGMQVHVCVWDTSTYMYICVSMVMLPWYHHQEHYKLLCIYICVTMVTLGVVRNDIYVTLEYGQFEKGSKRAERNVEVAIAVCDSRGEILRVSF